MRKKEINRLWDLWWEWATEEQEWIEAGILNNGILPECKAMCELPNILLELEEKK